jgi:hypothetical protein
VDVSVEISSIDQRYRHCRLRHGPSEQRLLCSMAAEGIRDPLLGFILGDAPVLLDGFKRLRCAGRLGINQVPFRSLGDDEAAAIVTLMRLANARSLNFIEQACLIDELRRVHKLTVAEIGRRLEKSAAWVSVRLGLTTELTPLVTEKIMSGAFPMHAYIASVRPITRVNKAQAPEIEAFVRATAGKGLSVRDLDVLARGYFLGGDDFRRHVREGDVRWCLGALRPMGGGGVAAAANDAERRLLDDLEAVQRRTRRLLPALKSEAAYSPALLAEAHILCGGLLRLIPTFTTTIKDFYARTRPQESDRSHARQGHDQA